MSLLASKPEITQINQGVQKLYEENLARHTKISYELPENKRGVSCVS